MRIEVARQNERGVAALVALLLISFMLVLVAANANSLFQLRREIRLIDKRQQQHWAGQTNAPALETKTP